MSRTSIAILGGLSLVAVVLLIVGLRGAMQAAEADPAPAPLPASVAQPAIDPFPAPDVGGTTLDGEPFALADYRGEPMLVNFWASWCDPCRREIPAIAAFAESHPEIRVIGINYQDDPADARAFSDETGITWPSVIDAGSTAEAFGVPGLPATFLIDRDGVVVGRILGEATEPMLDGLAESLARP
jgi:cytochrome c biogenesis protein CcmG/thiol:disulfide interchange protein DsbE